MLLFINLIDNNVQTNFNIVRIVTKVRRNLRGI